jgi:hypothetical protein
MLLRFQDGKAFKKQFLIVNAGDYLEQMKHIQSLKGLYQFTTLEIVISLKSVKIFERSVQYCLFGLNSKNCIISLQPRKWQVETVIK